MYRRPLKKQSRRPVLSIAIISILTLVDTALIAVLLLSIVMCVPKLACRSVPPICH